MLVTLSLATSLDALAVGVSMAMLGVSVWGPSVVIGLVAAALTALGIQFGARIGSRWESWGRSGRWLGAAGDRRPQSLGVIWAVEVLYCPRCGALLERGDLDAMIDIAAPTKKPPLPLLITGIAGVVGYNAIDYFRAKYPGGVFGIRQVETSRLTGPGVIACNAEDCEGLARVFDRHEFAAVLNCAGNCALKACELDPALAWRINVEGVRNLLSQTVPRGIRLVHLSVDLVFSGQRDGGYREEDPPDPVDHVRQDDGRRRAVGGPVRSIGLHIAHLAAHGSEFQRACGGHRLDHVAI